MLLVRSVYKGGRYKYISNGPLPQRIRTSRPHHQQSCHEAIGAVCAWGINTSLLLPPSSLFPPAPLSPLCSLPSFHAPRFCGVWGNTGKFVKCNMQFGVFWCTLATNLWLRTSLQVFIFIIQHRPS